MLDEHVDEVVAQLREVRGRGGRPERRGWADTDEGFLAGISAAGAYQWDATFGGGGSEDVVEIVVLADSSASIAAPLAAATAGGRSARVHELRYASCERAS